MASSLPPLVPVPFAEAIAWARARGVVLPDVYYGQLQGLARAKAFSVAGITRLDQLLLVHESLNGALGTGQTFEDWKKGALAQDSGLGAMPMHRLDNIFRTNIQSDYARGRCEQQGRNKEQFPWLLYDAVNDSRTRPAHAAMDGFIARHDDPIWSKWRPPCGYRCRCRLISLTEKQAQKYIDADARRLGNDKPQDHLWGLTYAQARSRAISDGPDSGWDYDICQECGDSQLDHCSGATRGIEQATDDRIRALHEVAGTPGGQVLADAVEPELVAAKDVATDTAEILVRELGEDPGSDTVMGWNRRIISSMETTPIADVSSGDSILARLYEETQCGGKPRVAASQVDFDDIESEHPVLFRGVSLPEQVTQFFEGEHYPGLGIFGNGTYSAYGDYGFDTAFDYGESVWRMKIAPGAKVKKFARQYDIANYQKEIADRIKAAYERGELTDVEKSIVEQIAKDPGRAMLMDGVDAYFIEDLDYCVVLNRSMIIADTVP